MTRRFQALNCALVTIETWAVGGLALAVAGIVLLQVLMRYLFAYPNPWSEEVSRFGFVWLSLLGASLAVAHGAHFGFDRVAARLPSRARSGVAGFAKGAVLALATLLVVTGVQLVGLAAGQRSPALDLPYAVVYAAVPASGLLMAVHMLAGWTRDAGRSRRGAVEEAK